MENRASFEKLKYHIKAFVWAKRIQEYYKLKLIKQLRYSYTTKSIQNASHSFEYSFLDGIKTLWTMSILVVGELWKTYSFQPSTIRDMYIWGSEANHPLRNVNTYHHLDIHQR